MTSRKPPEDEPNDSPLDPFGIGGADGGPGAATSDSRELPAFLDPVAPPSAVHVVSADPLYRRMFSRILLAAGLESRCYSSPVEFLAEVGPREAGCLLLDADRPAEITNPAHGGDLSAAVDELRPVELLTRVAASGSPIASVVVTAAAPVEPALAFIRRGAVDVLEKPVKRETLVAVVREALAASAARRDRRSSADRIVRLSEQQFRLLGLMASGWRDWLVALRLFVRPREVRRLRNEVLDLLGLNSVEDAVEVYREAAERQSAVRLALSRRSPRRRR